MEIGLYVPHHGLLRRDEENDYLQVVATDDLRPVEFGKTAESLGYDYLCFGDHIVMSRTTDARYPANPGSGTRSYPDKPNIFDGVVLMSAIASHTQRIRLMPSVLIAPYRHPLNDAKQFATIDVISNGRLTLGVGPGWMREEFDALGVSYEDRGAITEECIEIYKLAWTEPWLEFHGRFFDFSDISQEPKPVQKPRPPIIYGGITKQGARRAALYCDGFYPLFLDPYADPARYNGLNQYIFEEGNRNGRDMSDFRLLAFVSARIVPSSHELARRDHRPVCTGTAEQILQDLTRFAANGYDACSLHLDIPSGTVDEMLEVMQQLSEEVLPAARELKAAEV